jgi:hypothetical protein
MENTFKDGRELDDEQSARAVDIDFDRPPKELLTEIYKEATNENQKPDARIAKTVAKASTLFARLSADQERIARKLIYLTVALVFLTAALLMFAVYLYKDTHFQIQREQTAAPHEEKHP